MKYQKLVKKSLEEAILLYLNSYSYSYSYFDKLKVFLESKLALFFLN